jgi:hypothetical protein
MRTSSTEERLWTEDRQEWAIPVKMWIVTGPLLDSTETIHKVLDGVQKSSSCFFSVADPKAGMIDGVQFGVQFKVEGEMDWKTLAAVLMGVFAPMLIRNWFLLYHTGKKWEPLYGEQIGDGLPDAWEPFSKATGIPRYSIE